MDEFHIGGKATAELLARLGITESHTVLDVGCGLGGPEHFASDCYRCRVEGVDLTNDYVKAGNELTRWLKLGTRVTLHCADALARRIFRFRLHAACGMNIADKEALFREVGRVLKSGATLAVCDVMRLAAGTLAFPVPWATTSETSAVAAPDDYRCALRRAGFDILFECNRMDFALRHFTGQQEALSVTDKTPPLGLQTLMGARRKSRSET